MKIDINTSLARQKDVAKDFDALKAAFVTFHQSSRDVFSHKDAADMRVDISSDKKDEYFVANSGTTRIEFRFTAAMDSDGRARGAVQVRRLQPLFTPAPFELGFFYFHKEGETDFQLEGRPRFEKATFERQGAEIVVAFLHKAMTDGMPGDSALEGD